MAMAIEPPIQILLQHCCNNRHGTSRTSIYWPGGYVVQNSGVDPQMATFIIGLACLSSAHTYNSACASWTGPCLAIRSNSCLISLAFVLRALNGNSYFLFSIHHIFCNMLLRRLLLRSHLHVPHPVTSSVSGMFMIIWLHGAQ